LPSFSRNDCIPGETGQSFLATSNGNYGVIVTQNGCIDTSNCVNIIITGVDEFNDDNVVSVYPNPTSDQLNVVLNDFQFESTITIINNLGQVVYQSIPTKKNTVIQLDSFANGIYTLTIGIGNKVVVKKIIKE